MELEPRSRGVIRGGGGFGTQVMGLKALEPRSQLYYPEGVGTQAIVYDQAALITPSAAIGFSLKLPLELARLGGVFEGNLGFPPEGRFLLRSILVRKRSPGRK